MMVTIGRETGYLWDAQSGVYLGVLTLHNQSTSATVGIDVAAGVPLHEGTGRAVSGCQGQGVPPLGRGFAELSHGTESHNVTAAINKMSSTATMVTTAVAKRCDIAANLCSTRCRACCPPAPQVLVCKLHATQLQLDC